jgi:hypothetical protein
MMKNITMSIDENLLKKARKVAIDKNRSLTSLIKKYLEHIVETEESKKNNTARELQRLFNRSKAIVGDKKWSREELHER